MAEKKMTWTDQQKLAIAARGSDILVSASAGTGKTAVLSGRYVELLSDGSASPSVLNILVLTFTDAAAEQMRSRIAQQLTGRLHTTKDPNIARQLLLLQAADIGTIHSFCRRLIVEYFYKPELDLDPTFTVIDSDEATLLKAEVLEKTVDWAWQQSYLQQPLAELLYGRDLRMSDGFLAKIIDLSNFLEGVVSRNNWYERASILIGSANPFATVLGDEQKRIIADRLQSMLAQTDHCLRLCKDRHVESDFIEKWRHSFVEPITRFLELLRSGDWDAFTIALRSYQPPSRIEYKRAGLSDETSEIMQALARKTKSCLGGLLDLAILNPDYLNMAGAAVSRQTSVLIELVKRFDLLYTQAKRSLNCMDFADLERYALRLLTSREAHANGLTSSETALTLRQKYRYIFVDEYQDINPVQQAILSMLSSEYSGFFVGDVKQSVYAFRGAEPAIFVESLRVASVDPAEASSGLRVDLNKNFRSAKGILDFVNKIFSRIMTVESANISYDESANLQPAGEQQSQGRNDDAGHNIVELHILDQTCEEPDNNEQESNHPGESAESGIVSARQRQAALIAQRIRRLVGADGGKAEQIVDSEQNNLRDVQYRDIVVLMRSPAKRANDYVEILRLAGVPVSCDATAGYFQTTEITDIICLLKVLDNPQRDIELAAVLRSPLFKITDTELAKTKIHSRGEKGRDFYGCIVEYAHSGPDAGLRDKLKRILGRIDEWRKTARQGNIADLLWHIYRETDYAAFVSALPNGQARKANLLKLHDRAIQFTGFAGSASSPALARFVQFLEKLQQAGEDWSPAQPENAADNAVRILSVHKSKGLEFPIVFLAELQGRFNRRDVLADVIADTDDTLGLRIIDRNSNSKLRSLAYEVIAQKKLATLQAEEMRILYVAATRAKERLILTASQKADHCRRIVAQGVFFGDGPIPHWQIRNCQSTLDWILVALSNQNALHEGFETQLVGNPTGERLFDFRLHRGGDLAQLDKFVWNLKSSKRRAAEFGKPKHRSRPQQPQVLAQVKQALSWRYEFSDVAALPAKTSVTELTHRSDEYIKYDYSAALDRLPAALAVSQSDLPARSQGRLFGTAAHLVLSRLDLTEPVSRESIEHVKAELVSAGVVTGAVADLINPDSIHAFFDSEPGRLVLNRDNTIFREWPFTFALPISEFDCSGDERRGTRDEFIVIQGIIDMLVHTADGLVVVDFKTDHVSPSQTADRARLYDRQLELYGRAASAILKSPVLAKWLYFVGPRCAVNCKTELIPS